MRPLLSALLLTCTTASLAAQGPLLPLTTANIEHLDGAVSPDGNWVAFRTTTAGIDELGMASVQSGSETIIYTSQGAPISSFVWSPISQGLYFAEGNTIRFVGRSGGAALTLGTVAGSSADVWAVDDLETTVFGSRFNGGTGLGAIFRIAASGVSAPVDIYTGLGEIVGVRLDVSDQFLLFEVTGSIAFTPSDYMRIDVNGTNAITMYTTSGNGLSLEDHRWINQGLDFVFTRSAGGFQIARSGVSGTVTMYTDAFLAHRRLYLAKGGSWILLEGLNPGGGGLSPAVMSVDGGGVVPLADGQALSLNNGSLLGGLTIDDAEQVVAFSAKDPTALHTQIYIVRLDREIRIHPRVEIGGQVTIELPLAAGELGGVATGVGLAATPLTLAGINGGFDLLLSPTPETQLFGVGPGVATVTVNVPTNPALVGVVVYFQGIRLTSPQSGAFTRFGYAQIF